MSKKAKYMIIINIMFALYSLVSVFTKIASAENGITLRFIILYGCALGLMGIYAIVWQQIIKRVPLVTAYANKAVVIIWGMIWGAMLFGEKITAGKVAGVSLIVIGIVLFSQTYKETE